MFTVLAHARERRVKDADLFAEMIVGRGICGRIGGACEMKTGVRPRGPYGVIGAAVTAHNRHAGQGGNIVAPRVVLLVQSHIRGSPAAWISLTGNCLRTISSLQRRWRISGDRGAQATRLRPCTGCAARCVPLS